MVNTITMHVIDIETYFSMLGAIEYYIDLIATAG